MGSTFTTPLGDIDVSNGSAELIEIACAAEARRQASTARDDDERRLAEVVAVYLEETAEQSGSGCYGFDVCAEPFDDPAARRVFARAIAALGPPILASAEPFDFLTRGSINLRAYWLALVLRFHEALAASVPGVAPLRPWFDGPLAEGVAAHRLLPLRETLRHARRKGRAEADPARELAVASRLLAHATAAGDAFSPWLGTSEREASERLCAELAADLDELARLVRP